MICLDTNVVIAVLKQQPAHLLERFARELRQGTLALSTIVLFELQYGVANSARRKENTDRLVVFLQAPIEVLPFEPEDAEEAGELRAELRRAGTPIGPYDLLVAAQARRRGAVLVTANAEEFARVPGLKTQDWTAA
jgi:tRNA(fMet)-specific endonuclease VapC